MSRSQSLADKLNARLSPDPDAMEVMQLMHTGLSPARFDSVQEFAANLVEGTLLNVSVIGSRALSIPQGEYMVWLTDAGHTMLVPTTEKRGNGEVYEHSTDAYEVQTKDLMANWNRLERVIAENFAPPQQAQGQQQPNPQNLQQGGNEQNLQEPQQGEAGDEEEGKAGEFRNTIDASTVDRTPIMRAMQDRGFTVTSLAKEVGVEPPAISRILRTPKDVQGDPGGRNPSMGLASQICNVLRMDPTAAFPDIFNQNEKYHPRDQAGNDGSGAHSHGKGGGKWTQGASGMQESVGLGDTIVLLEANQNYNELCGRLANAKVPFDQFWRRVFVPTLLRTTERSNLQTFTEGLLREFNQGGETNGWDDWDGVDIGGQNANQPVQRAGRDFITGTPDQQGVVGTQQLKPGAYDRAVQAMNAKTLPAIQQAFTKAMTTLKTDLQKAQTAAGADPKIAPHAWKMADQFFKHVMKAGMGWLPKWKAQAKGTGNPYDSAYQQAAASFQPQQAQSPAQGPGTAMATMPQQGGGMAAMGGGGLSTGQAGLGGMGGDDVMDAEYEVKSYGAMPGQGQQALPGGQRALR